MANCSVDFAFANQEEAFVVKETTCGTLVKPSADDRIYTIGPVDFSQEQEFLDDEQLRGSPSRFSPIKGRKMPGDWSFSTYVKPSGTKGTAPEHDVLFECLMGTKTVNSGVSVAYTLADQVDSFSLWVKKGHTVFAFRGATIQTAEFTVEGNAIASIAWSGNYMEQLWAGEAKADGAIDGAGSPVTSIPLKTGHAQRFVAGMYIEVGDNDNSGSGFRITNVNYSTDTLTITPGVNDDQGTDPDVTPWWPSTGSEVGTPVHGKRGLVTIGGVNCIVLSARVTVNNNIKYYVDEKNGVFTAERFGRPGFREIDGSLSLYFLKPGPSYFYRSEYQVSNALVIPAGNVSGYIMELSIPYAEYLSSTLSGDEEFIQEVPFRAIASSSQNDELEIVFK